MKIITKDNNKWIKDGAPYPSTAAEDELWSVPEHRPEGVIENPDYGQEMETDIADPPAVVKVSGLSYDEFRALFGQQELIDLDNAADDDYMTARSLTPLTVLQKAQLKFLISEAMATGGGQGINLASPKMGPAVDFTISIGVVASNRKAEILAGTKKS